MGVSYRFAEGLLILECRDAYTRAESHQVLIDALNHAPDTGPQRLLIHDPGSSFQPPTSEVPFLAQSLAGLVPAIIPHVALVVTLEVKFGIGRMVGSHCTELGLELMVFRDLPRAKAWLQRFPVASGIKSKRAASP